MPSKKKFAAHWSLALAICICGAASASFATLLGILPGFPNLNYEASGATSYDASLSTFSINASPISIFFAPATPPRFVNPTGVPPVEVMQINIVVDGTGALVGGVPGDDLLIQGEVDADGNGSIDYSGVLLTGEVLQFGFEDTGTPTDFYDFRFAVTGGSLAPLFGDHHIGVTTTSEGSTFEGSFLVSFGGGAKGNVGPIDIPNREPECDAGATYEAECAGGVTTIQLDGTKSLDEDNDDLTFSWSTDCPNATIDEPTSATPILTVNTSASCEINCTVTLTVSDGIAPPVTCTAQVQIKDTNPPVPTCPGDLNLECSAPTTPAQTGTATAIDDCDPNPSVTHHDEVTPGDCAHEMIITRTWTATDRCNNSAECIQTLTIHDTVKPIITCPPNKTVNCQQGTTPATTGTATATDNCDSAPVITYIDDIDDGCCPVVAIIKRKWKATDACGNEATCIQTITVRDNAAPTVTCPPDKTISCNQSTHPSVTGWATASDSCDSSPQVVYSDTWLCTECPRVLRRKWKAKDDCGNSSAWCYQYITIQDNQAPVINCPPMVTKYCGQSTHPSKTGYATATDNCDNCPTISYTDTCSSGSCPRTITRKWKAKDECGNVSYCTQTIKLIPVPPCPEDVDYWKCNQNRWPCQSLTLGGVNYNSTKLMNMLRGKKPNGQAGGSDVTIKVAMHLIATEFSLRKGSPPDGIESTVDAAHDYLDDHAPGSNPTGWTRTYGNTLACELEDYTESEPNDCDDGGCGW